MISTLTSHPEKTRGDDTCDFDPGPHHGETQEPSGRTTKLASHQVEYESDRQPERDRAHEYDGAQDQTRNALPPPPHE